MTTKKAKSKKAAPRKTTKKVVRKRAKITDPKVLALIEKRKKESAERRKIYFREYNRALRSGRPAGKRSPFKKKDKLPGGPRVLKEEIEALTKTKKSAK